MFFFLMIRRPPRSTLSSSSAASDVYKRQPWTGTWPPRRRRAWRTRRSRRREWCAGWPASSTGWCRTWTTCLLYTSDAADEEDSVDLGGRRIIKKKKKKKQKK